MNCKNCGTKLYAQTSACPTCNFYNRNGTSSTKSPSWLKVFTIILVLLSVIASGTFAYGVIVGKSPKEAALDLLFWKKSTKEIYFQAEFKSFQKDITNIEDYMGDLWHLQNEMIEKPYKNAIEINGNFDFDGESDLSFTELQLIKLVLRGSKIVINSEVNPNELTSFIDSKLNINGTPIIGTQLYQSKEQTALKIPLVDSRYYYLNNEQFGKLLNNVTSNTNGLSEMVNLVEEQQKLHITQDEMMLFISRYAKVLNEQLKESNFTMKEDVTFEGEKLREITMTLSEDELKQLLIHSIDEIANSEKFNSIIQSQLYEASNNSLNDKKENELYTLLKEQISNQLAFPKGFNMKLLIDKDEYIVKRDISLPISDKSVAKELELVYSSSTNVHETETINNKKFQVFEVNGDANGAFLEWNSIEGDTGDKKTFNNTLSVKAIENNEEFGLQMSFNGTLSRKDSLNELDSTFTVSIDDENEPLSLSGKFNTTTDQNLNQNYSTTNSKISITLPKIDNVKEFTVKINVLSKTEFTNEVKNVILTQENSINIEDMSPYDFMQLFDNLSTEVEALFGNFGM